MQNPFEEKIRFIDLLVKFIESNHHILSRDFKNIPAEIDLYIKNKKMFEDADDYAKKLLLSSYPEIYFYLERLYYAIAGDHRPLSEKRAKFLRYHLIPDIAKNILSSQVTTPGSSARRLAEDLLLNAIHKFMELYLSHEIDREEIKMSRDESFQKRIWKEIEKKDIESKDLEDELDAGLKEIRKKIRPEEEQEVVMDVELPD